MPLSAYSAKASRIPLNTSEHSRGLRGDFVGGPTTLGGPMTHLVFENPFEIRALWWTQSLDPRCSSQMQTIAFITEHRVMPVQLDLPAA